MTGIEPERVTPGRIRSPLVRDHQQRLKIQDLARHDFQQRFVTSVSIVIN